MTPTDPPDLAAWIGRETSVTDVIRAAPAALLAATLDRDDPPPADGDPLPPLWHWLYHHPPTRQSELGPDGHPARGDFLPPVPLPRRMWAGSRCAFHRPLRIGESVARVSTIANVERKSGRSGPLVFVVVRHELGDRLAPAVVEEQNIVYREAASGGEPARTAQHAPADAEFSRDILPDEVLLFRYSALTFNGHRIHYDRRYVTEVEGYPGLVVHGPLLATLLLDLLRRERPDALVTRFDFRAVNALFDNQRFRVAGRWTPEGAELWAAAPDGALAMEATALIG
jgi:3-methylfumaryl-CoA hydratase